MSEGSFEVIGEDPSKFRDKIEDNDGIFYLKRSWRNKNYIGIFPSREEARIAAIIFKNNNENIDYFKEHNLFKYEDKYYLFKLTGGIITSYGVFLDLNEAISKNDAIRLLKSDDITKEEVFKKEIAKNKRVKISPKFNESVPDKPIQKSISRKSVNSSDAVKSVSDGPKKKVISRKSVNSSDAVESVPDKPKKKIIAKEKPVNSSKTTKSNTEDDGVGLYVKIEKDVEFVSHYYSMRMVDDSEISQEDIDFRKNLRYNYKVWEEGNNPKVLNEFTEKLAEKIVEISNKTNKDIIGLISAPSSKIDKVNTIVKSIKIIKRWDSDGTLKDKYNFSKKIQDFSDVLKRIEDVKSASKTGSNEERPTYEDHIRTIKCRYDLSKHDDVAFIILDDVYTKGLTMKACRYYITKNGVDKSNLYYLVIGKTKGKTIW